MKILLAVVLLFFNSLISLADDATLQAVLDEDWKFRLKEDPLFATSAGDHEYDALLPSVKKEDFARRNSIRRQTLKKLEALDRSKLTKSERISYDLLKQDLQDNISEFEFNTYLIPLNADSGFHSEFARLPRQMPFVTVQDYENYIARLNAFPEYMRQNISLLREGLQTGMVLPAVTLQGLETSISSNIVEDSQKSVFYAPFAEFPSSVAASPREQLKKKGMQAIQASVIPAYKTFLNFMSGEYIPKTRRTTAASDLPNGRKYYAYLVRHFTT